MLTIKHFRKFIAIPCICLLTEHTDHKIVNAKPDLESHDSFSPELLHGHTHEHELVF